MTTRRAFVGGAAALAAAGTLAANAPARGIRVRFLGAGASGWNADMAKNPHQRRQSSVLIENRVLIDFTFCGFDKLPAGCHPEVLFQTHSHNDHYDPRAAVRVGVKRMYVHETWVAAARHDIALAAKQLNKPVPEVIAVKFGERVQEGDLSFMAVPANHSTSRLTDGVLERTSLYLVEKGPARLLYATDTGGIMGDAARMMGIDFHVTEKNLARYQGAVPPPKPITAFIMEATNGDTDDDFRLFVHSSVQTVSRIVNMLIRTKRYMPPAGECAYLTHLGLKYRSWPSEKIDAELPKPLKSAYDGLEVVLG